MFTYKFHLKYARASHALNFPWALELFGAIRHLGPWGSWGPWGPWALGPLEPLGPLDPMAPRHAGNSFPSVLGP